MPSVHICKHNQAAMQIWLGQRRNRYAYPLASGKLSARSGSYPRVCARRRIGHQSPRFDKPRGARATSSQGNSTPESHSEGKAQACTLCRPCGISTFTREQPLASRW